MADWTSRKEYFDHVRLIASEAVKESDDDEDFDEHIHQDVDGSEWVIYTAGNIGVLQFSDADIELPLEEYGDWKGLSDGGRSSITEVLQRMAFFYLRSDVREHAQPLWDEKMEEDEDDAE